MTKYKIPDDHEWSDEKRDRREREQLEELTSVQSHEIDVILTTDPTEDMGYGRERYTASVSHQDDGPTVLYFIKHRWKGNFWRDVKRLDWLDVPRPVKQRVASAVACDGVDDLDPGHRLIKEGGESTWRQRKEEAQVDG